MRRAWVKQTYGILETPPSLVESLMYYGNDNSDYGIVKLFEGGFAVMYTGRIRTRDDFSAPMDLRSAIRLYRVMLKLSK